jgi:hypothetical protein
MTLSLGLSCKSTTALNCSTPENEPNDTKPSKMADAGMQGMPPPELIPGYYDNRSGLAIFCVVFCLTIATTMVGLRIWTRKFIIDKMGADDWAAIITLARNSTL